MEEPPPILEPPPEAPKPRTTSLMARLLNVFAVPGQVFDEIKASPVRVGNWLIPALLWAVAGTAAVLVLVSQPEIQKKLGDNIPKALDKQVEAGKLPAADAALLKKIFETAKVPLLIGVGVVLSIAQVFWWAFILWLFGLLFLKSRFNYVKGLEVAGLAMMLSVLGAIVTLLLCVDLEPIFSGQAPNLTVSEAALNRRSTLIGASADVFSIWFLAVMSVGLSRLTGKPFLRAAWLVFAYWVMQMSFLYLLGAGQAGL
jgi:Yip1 domain